MDNRSIKKLESDLWEFVDLLKAGSKLMYEYVYMRYKEVA